jgi:uncharacterized membrane protein YecN with MAPEG domain
MTTEATRTTEPAEEPAASHGHDAIHMPPNSWIPIGLALTLTMTLAGFLITAAVWIIGLVLTIVLLVAWYRAARREFEDLPD